VDHLTMPPTQTPAAKARPPYELWLALAASAAPHVLAVLGGGYGRVVTIAPLAAALVAVSAAAFAIAALEVRDDFRAARPSSRLIWATLGLSAAWILYAVCIGLIYVLVQLFCINQFCRGPLG
jgi:hypothetical protein